MTNKEILKTIIEDLADDRINEAYENCRQLPYLLGDRVADILHSDGPCAARDIVEQMIVTW